MPPFGVAFLAWFQQLPTAPLAASGQPWNDDNTLAVS